MEQSQARQSSEGVAETRRLANLLAPERLVDLSLTVAEDLPCYWPTHMPFQHKTYTWFEDRQGEASPVHNREGAGYQTRILLIDEHTGTHFDPPSHFVPPPDSGLPNASELGLVSSERVDLDQLMGPAAVIDCSDLSEGGEAGHSPRVSADRLWQWEEEHGELEPGDVVLLRGDWDRHCRPGPDGDAYVKAPLVEKNGQGWPAPSGEFVEHIYDRGVRCLGTDGASIGAADEGSEAHLAGLSRGMVYVEALSGLSKLPARGAYFIFLPIKVRDGTGGPGRAIAVMPE